MTCPGARIFRQELLDLLGRIPDEEFDAYLDKGLTDDPVARLSLAKRLEPFGTSSTAAVLRELEKWDLTSVAPGIQCPVLITDPDDEQFWPGQSRQLYDLVGSSVKELVRFTAADGANWHCEPMAPQVRAQRIFDWVETTVGRPDAGENRP